MEEWNGLGLAWPKSAVKPRRQRLMMDLVKSGLGALAIGA